MTFNVADNTLPALPAIVTDLDVALKIVARADFYTETLVTPLFKAGDASSPVAWLVEKECNLIQTDEVTWTYSGGIDSGGEDETSRLHDGCESYDEAEHIRFNMPNSVETLEDGTHAVVFAHAAVYHEWDTFEHDEDCVEDDCQCDTIVGWAMLAQNY